MCVYIYIYIYTNAYIYIIGYYQLLFGYLIIFGSKNEVLSWCGPESDYYLDTDLVCLAAHKFAKLGAQGDSNDDDTNS